MMFDRRMMLENNTIRILDHENDRTLLKVHSDTFAGLDLRKKILRRAQLNDAEMDFVNLEGANLFYAHLQTAPLQNGISVYITIGIMEFISS